jgi:chromosome segregation ATPase
VDPGFVLQIAAIAIGGGSVQLTIFLLRRRSELRRLDAESDATLLDSANDYIAVLHAGDKALRDEIAALKTEIRVLKEEWTRERATMRTEWDVERLANTEALEASNREVSRFRLELARVQADLMGAQAQIDELRSRLPRANPSDPQSPKETSR